LATQYRDCHDGPELNETTTSEGGIDAERTSKTATPRETRDDSQQLGTTPTVSACYFARSARNGAEGGLRECASLYPGTRTRADLDQGPGRTRLA